MVLFINIWKNRNVIMSGDGEGKDTLLYVDSILSSCLLLWQDTWDCVIYKEFYLGHGPDASGSPVMRVFLLDHNIVENVTW